MQRRRAAIDEILARMPTDGQHQLAEVLNQFAEAGGEPPEKDLWSVGWTTGADANAVS